MAVILVILSVVTSFVVFVVFVVVVFAILTASLSFFVKRLTLFPPFSTLLFESFSVNMSVKVVDNCFIEDSQSFVD